MNDARDLAAKEKKTVVVRIMGMMIGVYYPYRRTGDIYVVGPDNEDPEKIPAHCCQCDQTFPVTEFFNHVNGHNKFLKRYPHFIIGENLIAPGIELPKYQPEDNT